MSWFINQFVNAVLQLTIGVIILVVNALVTPLGFTPTVIEAYFPSITSVTDAFKALALCILFVIVLFQLVKIIFGDFSYSKKDEPVSLFLRAGIAIVLILYSMSAMSYLFNAFSAPFYVLTDNESRHKVFDVTGDDENVFKNSLDESFDLFLESAEKTSESTYEDAADRISDWLFPGISILKGLVELICIGVLGYKLIMFLLEILERYLILMFQAYTSPLIWPTVASQTTINIFKKWSEMLISNFLLLYLDFWLLGLIVDSMGYVFNPDINITIGNFKPNLILGVAVIYAMIRIAQMMGVYLQRIFAGTGSKANLGQEFMMAFMMVENSLKSFFRGGKAAAGAASGAVGESYIDKDNPDGKSGLLNPDIPKDPDGSGPSGLGGETYHDYRYSESKKSESLRDTFGKESQGEKYKDSETVLDPGKHAFDERLKEPENQNEEGFDPELTRRIDSIPLTPVYDMSDKLSEDDGNDQMVTGIESLPMREYNESANQSSVESADRLNHELVSPAMPGELRSYSNELISSGYPLAPVNELSYRNDELDRLGIRDEISSGLLAERTGLDERLITERLGNTDENTPINFEREPDGILTAYEEGEDNSIGYLYPISDEMAEVTDPENILTSESGEKYFINSLGQENLEPYMALIEPEDIPIQEAAEFLTPIASSESTKSIPDYGNANTPQSGQEAPRLTDSASLPGESIEIDINRLNRLLDESRNENNPPLLLEEGGGRMLEMNSKRPEKVPILSQNQKKEIKQEAAFYDE